MFRELDFDGMGIAKAICPCPVGYPVDKRVGNVRNNDASLIEPLPA